MFSHFLINPIIWSDATVHTSDWKHQLKKEEKNTLYNAYSEKKCHEIGRDNQSILMAGWTEFYGWGTWDESPKKKLLHHHRFSEKRPSKACTNIKKASFYTCTARDTRERAVKIAH